MQCCFPCYLSTNYMIVDVVDHVKKILFVREDINTKKKFSFGHCPNHLNPLIPPIRATWFSFFGRQKRRFARMTKIISMMIMMVAMIIMMIIMVILMMIMTKMTKKTCNYCEV